LLDYSVGAESAVTARIKHVVQPDHTDTASAASGESDLEKEWDRLEIVRRFNSEVQQRCIDDMAEHRGWGKGRGQGRKSPAAMRA